MKRDTMKQIFEIKSSHSTKHGFFENTYKVEATSEEEAIGMIINKKIEPVHVKVIKDFKKI